MTAPDANATTLDILSAFAERTKRKIFSTEAAYPSNVAERVVHHKRTFYMPANAEQQCFLAGYSDPKSFNENAVFFGVFFSLSSPASNNLLIRKKDFLDRLNFSLRKKTIRTGNTDLDSCVVILGNDRDLAASLQKNMSVPQLIRDILNMGSGLNIGLNQCSLDFIPSFEGKSHLGVFTRQKWIMESDKIEELFSKTEKLRKALLK